jgi:hypothetical protein
MQLSDLPEFAPKKRQVYPVASLVEGGIEHRQCPSYVGYIAGSDGSVWKGYLDQPRPYWQRLTISPNGQALSVWISTDTGQYRVRVAALVLDAWGATDIKRYIGYRDGDPANCRPENVYYRDSRHRERGSRQQNDHELVRRVKALFVAGDNAAYIAGLFGVPVDRVRDIIRGAQPHKPPTH